MWWLLQPEGSFVMKLLHNKPWGSGWYLTTARYWRDLSSTGGPVRYDLISHLLYILHTDISDMIYWHWANAGFLSLIGREPSDSLSNNINKILL